jgi:hypothetical protein
MILSSIKKKGISMYQQGSMITWVLLSIAWAMSGGNINEYVDDKKGCTDQSKNTYDCEKLTKEFWYLEGNSQKVLDGELNEELQRSLVWDNNKMARSSDKTKNRCQKIAALICYGANPNRVACGNGSRSYFNDHKARGRFICPLEYAVDVDDPDLVSFLVERGVQTNVARLKWFADIKNKMKSLFFGSLYHMGSYDKTPLLFSIRSLRVAQLLVPHIGIQDRDWYKRTVAHEIAKDPERSDELLAYYLETYPDGTGDDLDLANATDKMEETPLHELGNYCHNYTVTGIQTRAPLLIRNTNNINAISLYDRTPLDAAMNKTSEDDACAELIKLYRAAGGKTSNQM